MRFRTILLAALVLTPWCVPSGRADWLTGYDYRQEIVVAPSMTPGDLAGFPILVKITDPADHVFANASSTGQDIVFTKADGVTTLDREIEHFSNTGTSELDAWVKTNVSSSSPTRLYMYYKGTPVANSTSTWDSNFQMVQHLQENPVGTQPKMLNSAGSINHGTAVGLVSGAQVPGQINGSLDFAGTSGYVDCGSDSSLEMGTSRWTAEAWINTAYSASYNGILNTWSGSGDASSYRLVVHDSVGDPDRVSFVIYSPSGSYRAISSVGVADGNWHHVAGVRDSSGIMIFVDGQQRGSDTMSSSVSVANTSSLKVGRGFADGWNFDGQIDEVRISNTDRSGNWLKASFNNQSDPAQVSPGGFQTNAPWLEGYIYRQAICISKDAVTADQTDFPVPVQIDDPDNKVFSQTNSAQGHDVVFTTADGTTLLTHELERYNNTAGSEELCTWVKTSLSASEDTEIYMYYRGPDSSDPYSTGVWDGNYKMVQHLQEDPSGSPPQMRNSTSNFNHGTSHGMTISDQVAGKVDGSLNFDGSDDWVNCGSNSSLNTPGDYTIEMWVYNEAGGSSWPTLLNRDGQSSIDGYFWIYTTGTNEADLNFQYANGSAHPSETFSSVLGKDKWNHVVFIYDDSSEELKLYVDGLQVGGTRTLTDCLPVDDGTLYLGTYLGLTESYPFAGGLDEFRLSDMARDLDWILTGYNLMNPEPGYLIMGGVEWVPEPSALLLLALGGLGLYLAPCRRRRRKSGRP